jgi:hypothetical protein
MCCSASSNRLLFCGQRSAVGGHPSKQQQTGIGQMFLFKCVWFIAVGVALLGLGYIVAPIHWLRKWDRRRAQDVERRLGHRGVTFYFRALGVVMLLVGGFIAAGLMSVFR